MSRTQFKIAGLILVMAVLTYVLGANYLARALQVGSPLVYVMVFYAAIWTLLAYLTFRPSKRNVLLIVLGASVFGHLVAVLTSLAIHLAQPDGVQRLSNSVQQFGVLDAVLVYLAFPLLLGGWVLAPIAVLVCAFAIKPRLSQKGA